MIRWVKERAEKAVLWAEAGSLRYFHIRGVCCGDEFSHAVAARYDLERFGALPEARSEMADVLIVSGAVSEAASQEIVRIYQQMSSPKWVMALGSCACSGGIFSTEFGGKAIPGIAKLVPVDVFVPGCPPRPEAIIDGWIALQNKIQGKEPKDARGVRRASRDRFSDLETWGVS
ncbi:MAG: hypothetical protein RJB38_1963 [Pseudomonadota bacterium]